MTRDDIIRMAEEAGFECMEYMNDRVYAGEELGSLTTFAQLVAAHEREQCALLCRHEAHKQQSMDRGIAYAEMAQKIRART